MERQQSRPADQIRVRRNPKKGRYERETINSILDRGLVAHVALVDHGEPVCVPMLYARISRKLYIHGARSSRMIKLLAAGQQACMTVTLRQGLVLARSAFEHSANYESVVAFGQFEPIDETAAGRSGSRPHRCCSVVRRVNVAVWALVGLGHDRGWRAENEKRCRSRENAKAL